MTIAERIPVLTDAELANLNANARRLSDTGTPAQRSAAADLMPLIEAQIADRIARKPVKAKAVRKPKVVAEVEAEASPSV